MSLGLAILGGAAEAVAGFALKKVGERIENMKSPEVQEKVQEGARPVYNEAVQTIGLASIKKYEAPQQTTNTAGPTAA